MKRLFNRIVSVVCATAFMAVAVPFTPVETTAATTSTTVIYQSFENSTSIPNRWSTYDADGDGYCWSVSTNAYNAYTGSHSLYSTSALSWSNYLTPDDWLISPGMALPAADKGNCQLSFWIYTSYMSGYTDYIQVYASTSPITDPTKLTADQCVLDTSYYTGGSYMEMTADLNAYRGKVVYLAFRHYKATGLWQMYLDDITVKTVVPKQYMVEFPAATDVYTITPANGTNYATEGLDYSFTVEVDAAYKPANGTLTVTANGVTLQGVNGVYTIPDVNKKQEVTIDFAYAAGDVRPDNAINMMDVQTLYRGMSGGKTLNEVEKAAGNIDYHEELSMRDVMALFAYVSGQRSYIDTNNNPALIWKSTYADATNGFSSASKVTSAAYYINNKQKKDFSAPTSMGDCKQIFYNATSARVVNLADGYAITLPYTDFKADYSLSELRSRYESDEFVLNISKENKNPYGNTAGSWNTYLTEWLNRFVADDSFLSSNNISRVRATSESTSKLSGYTVLNYDLYINDSENIAMPYYHIAIIRKTTDYINFHILVMKATTNSYAKMDQIVKSFKSIAAVGGEATNEKVAFECEVPEYWSDETKAYYNKLQTQSATDWGFFSASMVDNGDSSYTTNGNKIQSEYDRLSTALDYDYEIMPTYTHIAWYNNTNEFPAEHAARFAGGNGFNGKPVLQLTYQFTTSNNVNLSGYTPMFDILRGDYEEQFRRLARDIKAYDKPILFRLNNEMNTDWTSYSGIVTLLDPDIYIMTWEYLYDIFLEEGVDNCIWIFNPIAVTTPYCDWGEYLNFMPDPDYVQVLGLTSYEMGNGTTLKSFEDHYRQLYEKNTPYYDNYPWIISEFGAGAGGEKAYNWSTSSWDTTTAGRNHAQQAQWVTDMFECFKHRDEAGYEFVKNIKGAVWFSCNDYTSINNTNYITNYFELDASLTKTLAAFKKGLAAQ